MPVIPTDDLYGCVHANNGNHSETRKFNTVQPSYTSKNNNLHLCGHQHSNIKIQKQPNFVHFYGGHKL